MIQSQPQMVGSNLFVVLMWMADCIHISYRHIFCTSIYNIISKGDAWHFLWLAGHFCHLPFLWMATRPPGQVHQGGTAWPGKLLRRDGIADEGGKKVAAHGISWLLVCWSWRWIGKSTIFNNPTVGIEDGASLFLILVVGSLGRWPYVWSKLKSLWNLEILSLLCWQGK